MVLKVKNSRFLLISVIIITIFFGVIYNKFYSPTNLALLDNASENYESIIRDSIMRLSYNLKKTLGTVETSKDITVIGVDGETLEKYGKPGGPLWAQRIPYDNMLNYSRKYFPPSCFSFDILFKSNIGESQVSLGITKISEDTETILKLSSTLKSYSETFENIDTVNLLKLSTLVTEQGESLVSGTLADLQDPLDSANKKVPVIFAYNLKEQEKLYSTKNNFNDPAFYEWSKKEVVGDFEEDLSEGNGTVIPFLKAVQIPEGNVQNIPNDFTYLPGGEMISDNFIYFVKLGFVNNLRDSDGVVRRTPLILGTKYYNPLEKKLKTLYLPSLSLLSCLTHWKATPADVKVYLGDRIDINTKNGIVSIPVDKYGRLLLNFNFKPTDLNYVSLAMINDYAAGISQKGEESFEGEFKNTLNEIKSRMIDKICLVGLTFTGNGDTGPTVIDPNTSLVYVHATAINSILKDEYLRPASNGQMYTIIIGICLLLGAGSVLMSLNGFSLLFFIIEVAIVSVSFAGIYYSWRYFPTIYLSVFAFSIFLFVVFYRYFSEEKEKLKIRNMFSTMVSSSVLDYMEEHPESFSLTGSKMPATMMFSDVAGFTTISEGLTPEKLVLLLNKYLTPMTDIIQDLDGYVDKYEGDAIMAEWGVPFPNEKHASLACYACLEQQKKLDEIREDLYKEFGYRLTVRMGINSGEVSAGNMGSVNRFSYTVMGDAVNLAARLEPTNKVYGTYILIGESTYDLAKDDIEARLIDKVVVVGKKVAIRVYELLARKGELSEEKTKMVKHYEKGLELHEERKWDEAIAEFKKALEIEPDDQASKVLIERVEEYKVNPPGDDWQGEYVRKSKD